MIEILAEEGFTYDSSSFPTVTHDRYGRLSAMPAGARVGQLQKSFDEVCVSCLKVAGKNIPWGGGGYLRIYPLWLFSRGVQRIPQQDIRMFLYAPVGRSILGSPAYAESSASMHFDIMRILPSVSPAGFRC